jgi:hypothetical protein
LIVFSAVAEANEREREATQKMERSPLVYTAMQPPESLPASPSKIGGAPAGSVPSEEDAGGLTGTRTLMLACHLISGVAHIFLLHRSAEPPHGAGDGAGDADTTAGVGGVGAGAVRGYRYSPAVVVLLVRV